MAYDARQKQIIAYGLALAGMNLSAARKWIAEHCQEVEPPGETTLRRWLREKPFLDLVAEQTRIVREENDSAIRAAERERVKREITGSELDRLARDETLLDDVRKMVADALHTPGDLPVARIAGLYERLTAIHDRRKALALPAVAQDRSSTLLIESLIAVLDRLVPSRRQEIVQALHREYASRMEVAASAAPPPAAET